MVKYNYTAYGTITSITGSLSSTIGAYNLFRYKGYYYDSETKMYYCKSRYYVPEWGRFLTPDSFEYLDPSSINGVNLYAYCGNDPINYVDPSGCFAISGISIGTIFGLIMVGRIAYDIAKNYGLEACWMDFTWNHNGRYSRFFIRVVLQEIKKIKSFQIKRMINL